MTDLTSSAQMTAAPLLGKLQILLVDDNIDHLFLTRRELESRLPCCIATAQSAEEALRQIVDRSSQNSHQNFDVVLLDNGLPDMSGLDVLKQVHSMGNGPSVILVAGQGSEAIAVEALRRGASDYIVKTGDYVKILPEVVVQVAERDRIRRRNEQLEAEHVRFARLAAVGEVAAGIAHEIRNPMTIIAGMASLIRDNVAQLSPEELHRCACAIVDNCTHLNQVLEEVLSNSQSTGQRAPMLLAELVDETLSFMRYDPNFRNRIEVQRHYQTRGLVIGNRDELKQVFINLFRNAAQAVQMAGKSHGILRIEISDDRATREVIVHIQDNGNGIPSDVLPLVFESGFTTKRGDGKVEGSGLGLGICRRIIEGHEGRLWAQPREPGTGALFCLALPMAPVENVASNAH
ncbi:MAG: ATP-binding protein [Armatimonadota bacterium]|nr:ATP-binding protein [Armatimonadota bacterium]